MLLYINDEAQIKWSSKNGTEQNFEEKQHKLTLSLPSPEKGQTEVLDFNSLRLFSSLRMNTCKDVYQRWWPYCLPSTEARWLIRDGNGGAGREEGGGGSGKRAREWRLDLGYRPKKTGETVDRCRQNNGSVKAVSPRHCPATSAPRNCCFDCRGRVTRTMSVALLLRNNLTRKNPTQFRSPAPPPCSWSLLG